MLIADAQVARWSPDGRLIGFLRIDGLYVARNDGSEARRLLDASNLRMLAWSPDGTKLAVYGMEPNAPTSASIWTVEHASGSQHQVASGAFPAWAPDSQRIAYIWPVGSGSGDPTGQSNLHLVNWLGQNDWTVVRDHPPDTPPIGMPDGRVEPRDLLHAMGNPFWSADGKSIYVASFVVYQALSDFFIWERADATQGGSHYLGEICGSGATPSPARQAVLFSCSSARGDTWFEARALEGDDSAWSWAKSERGEAGLAPAWSPDARAVAYYHCGIDLPGPCSLDLVTALGRSTLIPDVFAGGSYDLGAELSLDWGRDG